MGSKRGVLGAAVLAMFGASACTDVSAPADGGRVSVVFATAAAGADAAQAGGSGSLAIEGTNGTLILDEVRMIVAEFELKRNDDDDCPSGGSHESCEKFNAGPSFINLSLESGSVTAVGQVVPGGVYEELEFEVENLDDNEENPVEAQQIRELRARILSEFPDWPRKASLLVAGTFTPRGGSPASFRTYIDAEIEIELDFNPPLVVEDGASRDVTVEVDPALWFRRSDGRVLDLSSLDFNRTGKLLEFELEVERGFSRMRVRS